MRQDISVIDCPELSVTCTIISLAYLASFSKDVKDIFSMRDVITQNNTHS